MKMADDYVLEDSLENLAKKLVAYTKHKLL